MSIALSAAASAAVFHDEAAYFFAPIKSRKIGTGDKEFTSPAFLAFLRTRQRTLEAMQPDWTFSEISQHIMEQWSRMSSVSTCNRFTDLAAQQAPYIHEGKKFQTRLSHLSNMRRPSSPTVEVSPANDYSSKNRRDTAGAILYLISQWPQQGSKMALSELKATAKTMRQKWQEMSEEERDVWRHKADGETIEGVDAYLAGVKEQLITDWCDGMTEGQSKQKIMW
ncbi:hypothetical protein BC936DRAFT_144296 [Jimgerdemannia flammicorona]|uniref:HMG box domain-containing protein n=1 Tax=Jimgerdemannia flammicorona TaxID=994334 RepID=A0A432ZY53_9FUNG|nr:hypothetical protein BC936DRAFT_144296 [Jimgerdemannia flammicorona]